ncbi:MAG: hypothetical protein ACXWEI_07475 [Mycobacterium sp.]
MESAHFTDIRTRWARAAPAVVNAVCHATGVRVRDLPVTRDAVLGA